MRTHSWQNLTKSVEPISAQKQSRIVCLNVLFAITGFVRKFLLPPHLYLTCRPAGGKFTPLWSVDPLHAWPVTGTCRQILHRSCGRSATTAPTSPTSAWSATLQYPPWCLGTHGATSTGTGQYQYTAMGEQVSNDSDEMVRRGEWIIFCVWRVCMYVCTYVESAVYTMAMLTAQDRLFNINSIKIGQILT